MARYEDAFNWMMKNEDRERKGTVIRDAGGLTKYGISFRFLKTLPVSDADFDHDGQIDEDDIRVMTFEECEALYKPNFWTPIKGDEIVDQYVADKLFDIGVNAGVHQGVVLMQRALGFDEGNVDGCVGPKTLAAINAAVPQKLIAAFKAQLVKFRERIAQVRFVSPEEMASWHRRDLA